MNGSSIASFVAALGSVTALFQDAAVALRLRPDVTGVTVVSVLSGSDRPSVEWYVDTEFTRGEALSKRLLIYYADGLWIIEADISRITRLGSDVVERLERRETPEEEVAYVLVAVAQDLAALPTR